MERKKFEDFLNKEFFKEEEFFYYWVKNQKEIKKIIKIVKIIDIETSKSKTAIGIFVFEKRKKGIFIFYNEEGYSSSQFVPLSRGVFDIKLEFSLSPYGGVNLYTRRQKGGWELEKSLL